MVFVSEVMKIPIGSPTTGVPGKVITCDAPPVRTTLLVDARTVTPVTSPSYQDWVYVIVRT
jgi:hypothetical protein